jgi:hypothetical protein
LIATFAVPRRFAVAHEENIHGAQSIVKPGAKTGAKTDGTSGASTW